MSDDQQRFGDGQDNYLQGAQKAAEAAQKAGSTAQSAGTGASAAAGESAANAAAATVQAGVEGGTAVSEVAAGTAAGGPWGAIISAAWALRHTLFKILVTSCLIVLFLIVAVVSLPSIVVNNIFRTDPDSVEPAGPTNITESFDQASATVSECIRGGYDKALERVEKIIRDGGYDHELSMDALINNALISTDYDTCYTLAAYSASMQQRGTTQADLKNKLDAVADQMFQVTCEVKEITVPGETEEDPDVTVQYVICTIHPFNQTVILDAFGIDTAAQYGQFNITYGDAIFSMSGALKKTMYGSLSNGMVPPISNGELIEYLNQLTCSGTRKELLRVALSLVGRVPYFWGGKSAPGWNEAWNTPRLVTSVGSSSTGTIRPYGLDCSGFTDWVYKTALGVTINEGTWLQWDASYAITEAELLPGDLGFLAAPSETNDNHVLIYAGKGENGQALWVHCTGGSGVVLNSPSYVTQFRRVRNIDLEGDFVPTVNDQGADYG